MLGIGLLLTLLAVATATDVARKTIYNWTTYTGIVLALLLNAAQPWLAPNPQQAAAWGLVGLADSFAGLAACGGVMLVCYIFFVGGIGGGDVKLVAMIGALLGLYPGLEAMLWTLVLGGVVGLVMLVWQVGVWNLVSSGARYLALAVRHGAPAPLSDEERRPLKTYLFLAPCALAAVLIVHFELAEWI